MTHRRSVQVGLLILLLASVALAEAKDSIKIRSTEPPKSAKVPRAEAVQVSLTIEYELASADTGNVSLVFQDESGTRLPTSDALRRVDVKRGRGTVTLSNTLEPLPTTVKEVKAFVALFPHPPVARGNQESTQVMVRRTSTADSITYKVR